MQRVFAKGGAAVYWLRRFGRKAVRRAVRQCRVRRVVARVYRWCGWKRSAHPVVLVLGRKSLVCAGALPAVAAAVEGPLSVLDPAGPAAREAARLWWWMLLVAVPVWALVCALWLHASRRPPATARTAEQSSGLRWLLFGGVLLPGASIVALLVWGIPAGQRMAYADTGPPALTVEVTARQWQWAVRYPDNGVRLVDTLYLPAGEVVDIRLGSADVIHSFWIPRLGGKMDAVPGRIHRLRLRADEPGEYHGQCAEYCGIDHAFMRLRVQVLSPQAFAAWMEAAAR